jgi:hypothetical protein
MNFVANLNNSTVQRKLTNVEILADMLKGYGVFT